MGLKSAVLWLCFLFLLAGTWRLLDLPPESEMIIIVSEWFTAYGLAVSFFGSLLESLFVFGLYFPGSLIIFLSVALAPGLVEATLAVSVVTIGMLTGYTINYHLGKYGWYRVLLKFGLKDSLDTAQGKIVQNHNRYIFYTFWHPGLAAFTSTAAGTVRVPFRRFFATAVVAVVLWNTFWGVLVYSLGETALQLLSARVVLSVVFGWVLLEVGLVLWRRYRKTSNSITVQ